MNVLADRHHAGLYRSLQLLADRLGWNLYTPVGHEWWDAGIWNFGRKTWGDDRLARQFLCGPEWFHEGPLLSGPDWETALDPEFPDAPIRGLSLYASRRMRWDLVIATAEDNQHGFAAFAKGVGAKYVLQVGNTGQYVDWSLDPLAIVSSEVPILGRGVRYHQEMDPAATVFADPDIADLTVASSFVNCMTTMPGCWDVMRDFRAASPWLTVNVFGIDGPDGVVKPIASLADHMARSGFGYHDKAHGDGYGHVIHGWAAVGRPLIGHGSHYRGKLAEHFWQDGRTCIDLDKHSVTEAAALVRAIASDPDRHAEMCHAIRAEYDRIDHAAEADAIRALLS